MAKNLAFKKVVVKDVKMQWPRLGQPHRFNEREKKSEACPATAPGAAWSAGWETSLDEGKALFADLKAHYEDCQTRDATLPAFSGVFGMKKDEGEGVVTFSAKKNAMSREGKANKPPKVVGVDLKPLGGEDLDIWSGSVGHMRVLAFPSTNPQDGSGGISLMLDAVQVVKAEYGGDNLEDDFGPAVERDPFDDEPDAPPPAASKPVDTPAGAEF